MNETNLIIDDMELNREMLAAILEGLITRDGNYLLQSPSMKSSSFIEFIRGYNFQNDYSKMYDFQKQLQGSDRQLLTYKNAADHDCYFYYSSLGSDSDICLLDYVPIEDINTKGTDWSIIIFISIVFILLIALNGHYLLSINRELHITATLAEKANLAKSSFLSAMSHVIRTPMNVVIGMTEIAKHHVKNPDYVMHCLNKVRLPATTF